MRNVSTAQTPALDANERNRPSLPSARNLARLVLFLLAAYCLWGSLLTLAGAVRTIPLHGDSFGGESVNPFVGTLAARTGHLYRPLSLPPYTPQPFGPLFYLASAKTAELAGLDIDATIRLGRIFDFVSLLLCVATLFFIARRVGASRGESGLVAMLFLAQPFLARLGATMRPDLPMLLAILLSLYFALHAGDGISACALSGLFLGVGFLLKQSAGATALAIAIPSLLHKRYKRLVVFTLAAALPVVIALALLLWRREPFLEHFLAAGRATWSLADALGWLWQGNINRPGQLMLFAVAAAGIPYGIAGGDQGQTLVSFACVNALASLIQTFQVGGSTNYFIPAFAGCALLLPFAIRGYRHNVDSIRGVGLVAAVGFLAALVDCTASYPPGRGRTIPPPFFNSLRVLSDDSYLVLHTRDPVLIDALTAHSLELQGRWSSAGVVKEIEAGNYDLVVLSGGHVIRYYRSISFFGPEIVSALNANYETLCGYGEGLVLKPRSREVPVTLQILSSALGPCTPQTTGPNLITTAR
jgi:hypothetical protein